MAEKKFIIWDPRDGFYPTLGEDKAIISDGIIGRVTADNVYLKIYAQYKDDQKSIDELLVGEYVKADFRLSGEKGSYKVFRVK